VQIQLVKPVKAWRYWNSFFSRLIHFHFHFHSPFFLKRTNKGRRVLQSTGKKDIEVFEVKTLSYSKCKWRHCCLLKACNDWRHYHLRHVDEDIVAFEGMQWLKTLSSSKCKWGSLSPLKACNDWRYFCLRNVCGLPYRASSHATWLLTGRGSRTVCVYG